MLQGGLVLDCVQWKKCDGIERDCRVGLHFTERGYGVRWFHTGGIFAGLSESPGEVVLEAVKVAGMQCVAVHEGIKMQSGNWRHYVDVYGFVFRACGLEQRVEVRCGRCGGFRFVYSEERRCRGRLRCRDAGSCEGVFLVVFVQSLGMWQIVCLIGMAGAAHQAGSANVYTLGSDMFPKSDVASVTGLTSMAGQVGSMLFVLAVGLILGHYKEMGNAADGYDVIFMICGSAYLVSFVIFSLIVPRIGRLSSRSAEEAGV